MYKLDVRGFVLEVREYAKKIDPCFGYAAGSIEIFCCITTFRSFECKSFNFYSTSKPKFTMDSIRCKDIRASFIEGENPFWIYEQNEHIEHDKGFRALYYPYFLCYGDKKVNMGDQNIFGWTEEMTKKEYNYEGFAYKSLAIKMLKQIPKIIEKYITEIPDEEFEKIKFEAMKKKRNRYIENRLFIDQPYTFWRGRDIKMKIAPEDEKYANAELSFGGW